MSERKNRGRNLLRQKTLSEKISENRGKPKPMGQLMAESGYSPSYSRNPNQLKKTLTWQETMSSYWPDDLVAKKHKQLLNLKEVPVLFGRGKNAKIIRRIDANAVSKALDMIYKLLGRYKGTQPENEIAKTFHEIVARTGRLFPDSKPG